MAEFLTDDPNAGWPGQIPEIATSDPVLGGPGGPVNVPHQLLADRTNYLKANMGALSDQVGALDSKVDALDLTVEQILANGGGGGGTGNGGTGGDGDGGGGTGGGDGSGGGGGNGAGCSCPPAATAPTKGALVLRDANGRAQVESPGAAKDIANKAYVDSYVDLRVSEAPQMPAHYVISVVGI